MGKGEGLRLSESEFLELLKKREGVLWERLKSHLSNFLKDKACLRKVIGDKTLDSLLLEVLESLTPQKVGRRDLNYLLESALFDTYLESVAQDIVSGKCNGELFWLLSRATGYIKKELLRVKRESKDTFRKLCSFLGIDESLEGEELQSLLFPVVKEKLSLFIERGYSNYMRPLYSALKNWLKDQIEASLAAKRTEGVREILSLDEYLMGNEEEGGLMVEDVLSDEDVPEEPIRFIWVDDAVDELCQALTEDEQRLLCSILRWENCGLSLSQDAYYQRRSRFQRGKLKKILNGWKDRGFTEEEILEILDSFSGSVCRRLCQKIKV